MADHTLTRRRLIAHVVVFAAVWPALSILNASIAIRQLPYYSPSLSDSLKGAIAGAALSLPEFLVTAIVGGLISLALFTRLHRKRWLRTDASEPRLRLTVEPVIMLGAMMWGAALWFPAAIHQPLLSPLLALPLWLVLAIIGMMVVGATALVATRAGVGPAAIRILLVGALMPAPAALAPSLPVWGSPTDVVLLGVDSVSMGDVAPDFEEWVRRNRGQVYTRAVAPAMLTNAVWSSVLSGRMPSEHGVIHTFQQLAPEDAHLVVAARNAGYRTISRFSDQLTCSVGSDAGFDDDRSGPRGWRQLLLPLVHNSSVLVPLVRSVLPASPIFASAPNQAGSFTFSLQRELRAVFQSGARDQRTFVAAHLTYLHLPAYPSILSLSGAEVMSVLAAPAASAQDRALDWADVDQPGDGIKLHAWKRRTLFATLTREIDRSKILQAGGRVVIFSDHGERLGLTDRTFVEPRFHNVVLATLNLPARSPDTPRSLTDIGYLLGFVPDARTDPPAVEFAIFPSQLWPTLFQTARLDWSGSVVLDPALLAPIESVMKRFEPWSAPPEAR